MDEHGQPFQRGTLEVLVLLNNCTDDSHGAVCRAARRYPHLRVLVASEDFEPHRAHVGTARALLMDAAAERFRQRGRSRGIILSTDADSRPLPDWVAANWREVRRGADAVGGRVCIDPSERAGLPREVRRWLLVDIGYRRALERVRDLYAPDPHDPFPRHHQHYGASFAITAEAYGRCGGMAPLRSSEDVGLYHALVRCGARVRHSYRPKVYTSARLRGRAQNGMADALAEWAALRAEPQVEPAADAVARLQALGRARWERPHCPPDLAMLETPAPLPGRSQPIRAALRALRAHAEALAALSLAERLDLPTSAPSLLPTPSAA